MPYFECSECGQLANVAAIERSELRQQCPVCGEQTTWTIAFDSDAGVTY